MIALVLGLFLSAENFPNSGGVDPNSYYLRPGGVDYYLRPDGTSKYVRP